MTIFGSFPSFFSIRFVESLSAMTTSVFIGKLSLMISKQSLISGLLNFILWSLLQMVTWRHFNFLKLLRPFKITTKSFISFSKVTILNFLIFGRASKIFFHTFKERWLADRNIISSTWKFLENLFSISKLNSKATFNSICFR